MLTHIFLHEDRINLPEPLKRNVVCFKPALHSFVVETLVQLRQMLMKLVLHQTTNQYLHLILMSFPKQRTVLKQSFAKMWKKVLTFPNVLTEMAINKYWSSLR